MVAGFVVEVDDAGEEFAERVGIVLDGEKRLNKGVAIDVPDHDGFAVGVRCRDIRFGKALDVFAENQVDVRVGIDGGRAVVVGTGENLLHRRRRGVQRTDVLNDRDVGDVARRVSRDHIDVVSGFRREAGEVDGGVAVGGHICLTAADNAAAGAGLDLDLEGVQLVVKVVVLLRCFLDATQELGHSGGHIHGGVLLSEVPALDVVNALLDHDPMDGCVLTQIGARGDGCRGRIALHHRRIVLEPRRASVHRGEGQLLHVGAARAVRVTEPQVEVVAGEFLEAGEVVGPDLVFRDVLDAAFDELAEGAGAELLRAGLGAAGGIEDIIKLTALAGHDAHLRAEVGDSFAVQQLIGMIGVASWVSLVGIVVQHDARVAGGERGHGGVRRGERGDLDRAVAAAGVGHDRGDVVVGIRRQLVDRRGDLRVGGGERQIAVGGDVGVALGGRNQFLLVDGAVHRRADRPVDRTGLVARKDRGSRGRGDVANLRITGQQTRVGGGLLRLNRVHRFTGDAGRQAGADRDGIGQHLHGGARRVDLQLGDVTNAGHIGGSVQIQRKHRAVDVEVQRGFAGLLIDGEGIDGAHGNVELRAGSLV